MMKKKGEPSTDGEAKPNGKTDGKTDGNGEANGNGNEDLPKNVSFMDLGNIQNGVKILMGTNISDDQADKTIDMVVMHAKDHPALPFVVKHTAEGPGIVVTVMADGLPYWEVANTPDGAGLVLTKLLNENFPKPGNGDGGPKVLQPGTYTVRVNEALRLEFGDDMEGIGYKAPVSALDDMTRSLGGTYLDVKLLRAGPYEVTVSFSEKPSVAFNLTAE